MSSSVPPPPPEQNVTVEARPIQVGRSPSFGPQPKAMPKPKPMPRPKTAPPAKALPASGLEAEIERLNTRLQTAVHRLNELTLKVEARVDVPPRYAVLFRRHDGAWSVFLDPEVGGPTPRKEWHQCSLAEKAVIAQALPDLLTEVLEVAAERASNVAVAHKFLDVFETVLGQRAQQQEGA